MSRGRSITDAFRQLSTYGGRMDNSFALVHAVFHVVLFFAIHAGSTPRTRGGRRPPKPQLNYINERKSHETRSPLSKPIALSQELQTRSHAPHQAGEVEFR